MSDFELQIIEDRDESMLTVSGELDMASAPELHAALAEMTAGDQPRIVIDATELTFLDSTAVDQIVRGWNRARDRGGSLTVRHPPAQVRRMLHVLGLTALIDTD